MNKKVYSHLLEPEKYRDYGRRYVKVPTWKTFGYKPGFVILRCFSQKHGNLVGYKQDIDLYTKTLKLGNVIWPFFETLFAENFKDFVNEIKKRGLYLFDFWGYVPGSNPEEIWGQVIPPEGTVEYMEKVLENHFLGIDNGEQDGRYIGGYAAQMCPGYTDRQKNYLNFHKHFETLCSDLKNKMSVLVSLSYGHYFLKEGNTTLIGAETAQALPNSQVYYAFLRGGGKQYGVLWFGNASVWNRWGYKTYESEGEILDGLNPGKMKGPKWGSSLMLLKRLIYTHYLYNCVILGFEQNWILGDNSKNRIAHLPVRMESDPSTKVLTPIGTIQAKANEFVQKHNLPGVMYTPVCLLLDFYSGWAVPRHFYTKKLYQVWGNMPYSAGDYFLHGIFSMFYPGYENASYYRDERGFLTPTPYGDMVDVMLSDVEEHVLAMYSTVIVAGELSASDELKTKLEGFVKNGGRLVITAGNIVKFKHGLMGLQVEEETVLFPAHTVVTFDRTKIKETRSFSLYRGNIKKWRIIGKCKQISAVIEVKYGKGEMAALMTPFGVSDERGGKTKNITIDGETTQVSLPNPYLLLTHVKYVLDSILQKEKIFDVGEGLGYITCRKKRGRYTLGIYNNSLEQKEFDIKTQTGKIEKIRELPIDCSEKGERGYLPNGFEGINTGENTKDTIAGGDIRIFDITVKGDNVKEVPPLKKVSPPVNRHLGFQEITSIKEEILCRPTFFQHFSGVKVNWDYLRNRDLNTVKEESGWFRLQKIGIIVDFSKGLDFYPGLTVLDNIKRRYEKSKKEIVDVFDKMDAIGAADAVFCLHRKPENHFSDKQTEKSFLKNIKDLCGEAAGRNITIHLQNHPNKWHAKSEEMISFISRINAANLRFCFNTGHILMNGENLKDIFAKAEQYCSMVLVNAPDSDYLNQMYDAHLPISNGKFEKIIRDSMVNIKNKVIVLDAVYKDRDEEYQDLRIIADSIC